MNSNSNESWEQQSESSVLSENSSKDSNQKRKWSLNWVKTWNTLKMSVWGFKTSAHPLSNSTGENTTEEESLRASPSSPSWCASSTNEASKLFKTIWPSYARKRKDDRRDGNRKNWRPRTVSTAGEPRCFDRRPQRSLSLLTSSQRNKYQKQLRVPSIQRSRKSWWSGGPPLCRSSSQMCWTQSRRGCKRLRRKRLQTLRASLYRWMSMTSLCMCCIVRYQRSGWFLMRFPGLRMKGSIKRKCWKIRRSYPKLNRRRSLIWELNSERKPPSQKRNPQNPKSEPLTSPQPVVQK